MNFDSIQSNWNQTSAAPKSRDELQKLTRIKHDRKVRRLRVKFVIEALLVTVFLFVFYNAFDGDTKPRWANLLLVTSGLVYIFIRFLGWRLLQNPVKGPNLKSSMKEYRQQLKRIAISVLVSSFVFGGSVIVFFTSGIAFSQNNYFLLAGMLATLIIFVFLAGRIWMERVQRIGETLEEMKD